MPLGITWNFVVQGQSGAITPLATGPLDLASQANTEKEVFQNVRTILTTSTGSVMLDRAFGVDFSFLDQPIDLASRLCYSEVIAKISKYEPRAKVERLTFGGSDPINGTLQPTVIISINLNPFNVPPPVPSLTLGTPITVIDVSSGLPVVAIETLSS